MFVYAEFRPTPGRPPGYQAMSHCPQRWLSALQGKRIDGYDPSEFQDLVQEAGLSERSTLSLDLKVKDCKPAADKAEYLAYLRHCLHCERVVEFSPGESRATPLVRLAQASHSDHAAA